MNIFKWFKNRKNLGNEIVYNKEMKRGNCTISATINVLPTKEVQLYIQFDVNNIGSCISLYPESVDAAKKMIDQIDGSFNTWSYTK